MSHMAASSMQVCGPQTTWKVWIPHQSFIDEPRTIRALPLAQALQQYCDAAAEPDRGDEGQDADDQYPAAFVRGPAMGFIVLFTRR